jgi:hydroxymethylpyrimidine/phosphomethylpyrimidine kinase
VNGRVLIVAGSDSSGGAGVQADLKTVTALGAYGATAITALTVQNTEGISEVLAMPPDVVAGQIRAVLDDIGADCIKLGMLATAANVGAVADALAGWASIPVVVDPVMAATSGDRLLDADALALLKAEIVPRAAVLTPNAREAAALTGTGGDTIEDAKAAARALIVLGAGAAVVTGGDRGGDTITDVFATADGVEEMTGPRIETTSTHGTGCTFASAIAAGLAQGMGTRSAVVRARAYVLEAIRSAPGYGRGRGPLNHGHNIPPFEPGGSP